MSEQSRPTAAEPRTAPTWGRALAGLVLLAVFAAAWFALAGRWTWLPGWAFLVAFTVYSNALALWTARTRPELYAERTRRAENVEPWDRKIILGYNVLFLGLLAVAALDSGRFGWSRVPVGLQAAAWVALAVAAVAIWHLMATNPYLSSLVRIQDDRGQSVVTDGAYGLVRHPMYVAIVLSAVSLPLALASAWALVPGVLMVILMVYRTAREDRVLREKLAGYEEYVQRVRYRLIPGVW